MLLQLLANGIVAGSVYAVVALGFALIYRTVRFFHFAHGAVYMFGAYVAYAAAQIDPGNSALGVICAAVSAGILGAAIDQTIYRPLRSKRASALVFLIVSFGAFLVIQNFVQLVFGAEIRILQTQSSGDPIRICGAVVTRSQAMIIVAALSLVLILSALVRYTKLGKAIRAVSDDAIAATVVGINPEKIVLASMVIGSAAAGVAGALVALETNLQPTMGMAAILKGMVASIVGGIGSIPGAVLGAFFLGIVENLGIWRIESGWKDTIAYLLLLAFLLLRPGGILGVRVEKART